MGDSEIHDYAVAGPEIFLAPCPGTIATRLIQSLFLPLREIDEILGGPADRLDLLLIDLLGHALCGLAQLSSHLREIAVPVLLISWPLASDPSSSVSGPASCSDWPRS